MTCQVGQAVLGSKILKGRMVRIWNKSVIHLTLDHLDQQIQDSPVKIVEINMPPVLLRLYAGFPRDVFETLTLPFEKCQDLLQVLSAKFILCPLRLKKIFGIRNIARVEVS